MLRITHCAARGWKMIRTGKTGKTVPGSRKQHSRSTGMGMVVTGSSHRAYLADPLNAEQQDPDDPDDDTGHGFSNASVSNDDCEEFAGGGDSVNYGGDNSTGYDTRVGSADLGQPFIILPNERSYRQNDTLDTRDSFFGAFQFQPDDRWDKGKFVLSQIPPSLKISCHFQVIKHPSHIHDEVTHGLSNPLYGER